MYTPKPTLLTDPFLTVFFHNIGRETPLTYGRISVRSTGQKSNTNHQVEAHLKKQFKKSSANDSYKAPELYCQAHYKAAKYYIQLYKYDYKFSKAQ